MEIRFLCIGRIMFALSFCFVFMNSAYSQNAINRQEVVQRHNVIIKDIDSLASLSVGNGQFAYTVDATGMQSFPETYQNGIPLSTQSEWGWNSFENTENYRIEESYSAFDQYGRKVDYCIQLKTPERSKGASEWFRQNVHRLQLGNLGLEITKKDGSLALARDIKSINQKLDLWTGEIKSEFTVEGEPVTVYTVSHQEEDRLAFKIISPLLKTGKIKIRLRFPYPTGGWADEGVNWLDEDKHQSSISNHDKNYAVVNHKLYQANYYASLLWSGKAELKKHAAHYFLLQPATNQDEFSFGCLFSEKESSNRPDFAGVQQNSYVHWERFWKSGGVVDFSECKDKRAFELERRVVLSQYLTKIQCTGTQPPQETGLTSNSWFGKPHLEMHWWHGVHFPLWGRMELLEKSLPWYEKVSDNARKIAKRQGFEGLRWQKMTDPDGNESPSSIGALLIWQQPHFITFAELAYRNQSNKETINEYKKMVFETADFMASFAHYDQEKGRYMLGKGLIPAQERFKAVDTYNPTYELTYWKWALNTAQKWRERDGLARNKKWDDVINKISPLPVQNSVYLATESATDSYTNPEFKTDHPSVLGSLGMLPQSGMVDTTIMKNTFNLIWKDWSWTETWGWDFPMTAMTAARLDMPDKAVDALLMNIKTNTYLVNGHNYQDDRLRLYLPGNGGVLTTIAMMCAGWDGSTENNPGFPKDGNWNVKWEGLQKMP
jgi:hypothetical protein